MELTDAINGRRSVRRFKSDPVPDEALRALIEAASMAPSGSNVQAWKFGLVTDPALVREVDRFSPGLSGNPPAIVAVCSDRRYALERGGVFAAETMARLDAAYASQNIMLMAHALGLGTCAIKSYNEPAIRRLLQLPDHIELELLISLGYPDHEPRTPRRKPVDGIAFRNVWSAEDGEAPASAVAPVLDSAPAPDPVPSAPASDSAPAPDSASAPPASATAAALTAVDLTGSRNLGECALDGDELFDLLVYMSTSAAGLKVEPAIYGPLRLVEASRRLAAMMARALDDASDSASDSASDAVSAAQAAHLSDLVDLIDARKNDCMTDPESFYGMLGDVALKLVDCPRR